MQPATLYAIITNHGFGHAARSLGVLREAGRRLPDLRIVLNTSVPKAFAQSMLGDVRVEYRDSPLDVGIHQKDFLAMDLDATLRDVRALYLEAEGLRRVEAEAAWIQASGARLVFADIPPLAADAARAAGVDCWMLGNFGWDFIYRGFAEHASEFERAADRIGESYGLCQRLFRPPFSEGETMNRVFPHITEVGLTGARPQLTRAEIFERLGLNDRPELHGVDATPLVLLSFGGLGLDGVPYAGLAEFDGRRRPARFFLTFDSDAPPLANLRVVDDPAIRQVDLLPHLERIVSKPGHGTFCEVARAGTPFVCLNREDFPETPGLLRDLRNHFTHRLIPLPEFFDGNWDFITGELTPPQSIPESGAPGIQFGDGNAAVAREIAAFFE